MRTTGWFILSFLGLKGETYPYPDPNNNHILNLHLKLQNFVIVIAEVLNDVSRNDYVSTFNSHVSFFILLFLFPFSLPPHFAFSLLFSHFLLFSFLLFLSVFLYIFLFILGDRGSPRFEVNP